MEDASRRRCFWYQVSCSMNMWKFSLDKSINEPEIGDTWWLFPAENDSLWVIKMNDELINFKIFRIWKSLCSQCLSLRTSHRTTVCHRTKIHRYQIASLRITQQNMNLPSIFRTLRWSLLWRFLRLSGTHLSSSCFIGSDGWDEGQIITSFHWRQLISWWDFWVRKKNHMYY